MIWKIATINPDVTTTFAAEELQKYLKKIDNSREYVLMTFKEYRPDMKDIIWVGIDKAFPVPKVKNPEFDDGISVEVHGQAGYISGTNSRSVLIAVYRFLKALGCAFFRPGEDGEVIPSLSLTSVDVSIFEAASQRHRSMYSEAAASQEQLLKIIDWLPKIGMNGYFFQFFSAFFMFNNWYAHKNNPTKAPENFTENDSLAIKDYMLSCMKKRGLNSYAVGHGWNCRAFGLPDHGIDITTEDVSPEALPYLAMLNGKRQLFNNRQTHTQMCYSSKVVQDRIAKAVREYAQENPMVDYVMLNLSDGRNNYCECDECRKVLPSDNYIRVLNAIDRELTKHNLKTRVVFTAYMDLLWEPVCEKIENPDRFVMKLFPYGRSYAKSLEDSKAVSKKDLPKYELNKTPIPTDEGVLLRFLKNWQEFFGGDTVIVDYQLMWDHYRDAGDCYISDIIFRDMKALKGMNVNGFFMCQTQRVFLPTALSMVAMAGALWNQDEDYDALCEKYFSEAFGKNGKVAHEYLAQLSKDFDRTYWKCAKPVVSEEGVAQFKKAIETIENFKPTIEKEIAMAKENGLCDSQIKSWGNLIPHGELYTLLAKCAMYLSSGDLVRGQDAFETAMSAARLLEDELQYVFDAFEFITVFKELSYTPLMRKFKAEAENK